MKTLKTIIITTMAAAIMTLLGVQHAKQESSRMEDITFPPLRILISDATTATVYNAVASQCNEDCLHTASMFKLDPERIAEYRIVAMERTMMQEHGISYGDRILIEGAGDYDGEWTVEDTMNKRFAGQHRIDFLVPENIKHGKWDKVKIYKIF